MGRIESLEHRTLLAASIIIDGSSVLSYESDAAPSESVRVSVLGTIYTFSSNRIINVAENTPGLSVTGDGTNTVTVDGISALNVAVQSALSELIIDSTNTPTDVVVDTWLVNVLLGGLPQSATGLDRLSAPISVQETPVASSTALIVSDFSAEATPTYTITPTTVDATGGFGGLTYSGGIYNFQVRGSSSPTTNSQVFNVTGTADNSSTTLGFFEFIAAPTIFNIQATSADQDSRLTLYGTAGGAQYNVRAASSPIGIIGGAGANTLRVGQSASTAGVASTIDFYSGFFTPFDVFVDDSAGTAPARWRMNFDGLTGLSGGGGLKFFPPHIQSMDLQAPTGFANQLTLDFSTGSPLPQAGQATGLSYDGGAPLAGDGSSDLVLIGHGPQVPGSLAQVHTPTIPGAGTIEYGIATATPFVPSYGLLTYSGLSTNSIYDTTAAASYTFNAVGLPSIPVAVGVGERSAATGDLQTLLISAPGAFTTLHLANKGVITVDMTSGGDRHSTVDYSSPSPVAGLVTLALVSGLGDDRADLIDLPPGAATTLSQGGGSDHATLSLDGALDASAVVLNGGEDADSLLIDADGVVTAAAFFAGAMGSTIIAVPSIPGGVSYSNYESVVVSDAAPIVPTVFAIPIHGVVGQPLVDVMAGAFVGAAGTKASDYAATIDWGDGSTSAGVIVQDGANPLVFYVYGTHTYYDFQIFPSMRSSLTVRSLGTSSAQYVGGVLVTIATPQGTPVTSSWQTFIKSAPIDVVASSFSGFENIPIATSDPIIVATFTDLGGLDPTDPFPASRYLATINWGDGSFTISPLESQRNGTTNSFFVLAEPHTYATPGSYAVTVTITDRNNGGGATALATGVAVIADAPLTQTPSQPTNPNAQEGVQFVDWVIGSFVDANPLATTDQYTVAIDWNDGSPTSLGRVIQPGGPGTTMYVVGTHTYTNSRTAGAFPYTVDAGPVAGPRTLNGTYRLTMAVRDTFGSTVNLFNDLDVADRPLSLSGAIESASDTGDSNSDGVTHDSTPTFSGVASEGGAVVYLYASLNGGGPVLIGSTTAGATGAWNVTSANALADGGYRIQAQAYDAFGHTIGALATLTSSLVVDTVGPKVTGLVFDSFRGQVIATFRDFGGVADAGAGLAQSSLRDASNFRFAKLAQADAPVRRFLANSILVSPGTGLGDQVATVRFNDGTGIRGGRYLFTARSVEPTNLSGIRDLAGNALDGEYYGYYPSGNDVNGGDLEARLDARHQTISAPRTQVGEATPRTPAGLPATGRFLWLGGRLLPSAGSAVRLASARGATRPGRLGS